MSHWEYKQYREIVLENIAAGNFSNTIEPRTPEQAAKMIARRKLYSRVRYGFNWREWIAIACVMSCVAILFLVALS
jgi:hypothetical protein